MKSVSVYVKALYRTISKSNVTALDNDPAENGRVVTSNSASGKGEPSKIQDKLPGQSGFNGYGFSDGGQIKFDLEFYLLELGSARRSRSEKIFLSDADLCPLFYVDWNLSPP